MCPACRLLGFCPSSFASPIDARLVLLFPLICSQKTALTSILISLPLFVDSRHLSKRCLRPARPDFGVLSNRFCTHLVLLCLLFRLAWTSIRLSLPFYLLLSPHCSAPFPTRRLALQTSHTFVAPLPAGSYNDHALTSILISHPFCRL